MTDDIGRLAIYPGSFDPITCGHEDIVRRALAFADHIVVAVAHTASQRKQGLFSIEERVEMMREIFEDEPRIEVAEFSGLLVDFAKRRGARLLIRGLRFVSDFEYEFQLALMNHRLWEDVETVFLVPDVQYSYLSASLVREIASLGGDVSEFVSPVVDERLRRKFAKAE